MREQWRAIPGWEGLYEASDQGRIKSLYNGRWHIHREKILSPKKNSSGYLFVILCNSGYRKTLHVGRLVLSAFVSVQPSLVQCNHIDGNPLNNKLVNLHWCTQSHNQLHRFHVLKKLAARGEQHHHACLTEKAVLEIRRRKAAGETQRELAAAFGCGLSAIKHVVKRRSWQHV